MSSHFIIRALFKVNIVLMSCLLTAGCTAAVKDGIYKTYYQTGGVKTVESYRNGKLNGISREYYESGTLKHAIEYKDGKIDGMYNTYHSDGSVWRKEIYKQGRFLSQWEYDEEGFVIPQNGAEE